MRRFHVGSALPDTTEESQQTRFELGGSWCDGVRVPSQMGMRWGISLDPIGQWGRDLRSRAKT
jgi:hypothetical protein